MSKPCNRPIADYKGNPFEDLAKALNDGAATITLTESQAAKLIEIHDAIVAAKNELVREQFKGCERVVDILTDEAA